jgi:hypothetical protein
LDLEDRQVPTNYDFWWLGGSPFGLTDPRIAANWATDKPDPPPYQPGYPIYTPGSQDNVYFDASHSNNDCTGLVGTFNSVHLVNAYSGTVKTSQITVGSLELTTGRIDPVGNGMGDIYVSSSNPSSPPIFNWMGGVLNGSGYIGSVHLLGVTTTLSPPSNGDGTYGTLTTGDSISFEDDGAGNGSLGTITDGTFDWNNGSDLVCADDSEVDVEPENADCVFNAPQDQPGQVNIPGGVIKSAGPKNWQVNNMPAKVEGGELFVDCPGATASFTGNVDKNPNKGSVYMTTDGKRIAIVVDSTLAAANGVVTDGGKISTVQNSAQLRHRTATIQRDLTDSAADVVILDGTSPRPMLGGGQLPLFGQLLVKGNVWWSGGTYRPVVDNEQDCRESIAGVPTWVPQDYADLWTATGTFSISSDAMIIAGTVDDQTGNLNAALAAGPLYWIVIQGAPLCGLPGYTAPWTGVDTAYSAGLLTGNSNWLTLIYNPM